MIEIGEKLLVNLSKIVSIQKMNMGYAQLVVVLDGDISYTVGFASDQERDSRYDRILVSYQPKR